MYEERLRSSVVEIYEAASKPELWPTLLRHVATSFGGSACALSTHNFGLREGTIPHAAGYDPAYVRSYAEWYSRHNVWLREESYYQPVGTISTGQQLVPDAELVTTEFYNEWLRPQHLHHRLTGVVRREGSSIVYLAVMRPLVKESFGPDDVGMLRRLLPHFEQAVRLYRRLSQLQMERDDAKRALDLLPTGILLVNEVGEVLLASRRAEDILEARDGLTVRGGELRASNEQETQKLRSLVTRSIQTARGRSTDPGGALRISRRLAARPLQVVVSPVRGVRCLLAGTRSAAAILLTDPDRSVNVHEAWLCQLHGLSRVEARLAALLVQGKSVEQAAKALRISVNTGRAYLKRIFDKTGVNRQAELVRLVLIGPAQLRATSLSG
ncbi:MAG: helix-turn-helix transcriptional regulator [Woeseiaceae bacterium]